MEKRGYIHYDWLRIIQSHAYKKEKSYTKVVL
jgi:hypothetical protein